MGSGLPASSLPSRLQPKPGKHLSTHPPTHIFLAASRARLASDEPEPKPHHTLCAACELALLKERVSQGQATWHGSGNNKVGIYKLVRIFAGCAKQSPKREVPSNWPLPGGRAAATSPRNTRVTWYRSKVSPRILRGRVSQVGTIQQCVCSHNQPFMQQVMLRA